MNIIPNFYHFLQGMIGTAVRFEKAEAFQIGKKEIYLTFSEK